MRPPQSLTRNESNQIRILSSPPRKRGSRATVPAYQPLGVDERPTVCRSPLGSRFRGNDDRNSTYWKTSIHFRSGSEEHPEGVRLEGRTAHPTEAAGVDNQATPAAALIAARRVVLKIGSALLVEDDGEIRRVWLDALVDDVARCRRRGQEVIIVSSGAIAVPIAVPS